MKQDYNFILGIIVILGIFFISGCVQQPENGTDTTSTVTSSIETTTISGEPSEVPNPASAYCGEKEFRGVLDSAGSVGYCIFDDNTSCEEWSYYYNNCGPSSNNSYDFYDELAGSIVRINETTSQDGSITHIDADYCINKSEIINTDKQKLVNHLIQYYISEGGKLMETYRVDIMNISCCDGLKPTIKDSVHVCE